MDIENYLTQVNEQITTKLQDDSITPVIVGDALSTLANLTKTNVDILNNSINVGLDYIIPTSGGDLNV